MKRRALCLFLCFFLAGCSDGPGRLVKQYGGEKTKPDMVVSRRIVLTSSQKGEKLSLTYFEKGQYVSSALRAINKLFRDRRTGEVYEIDPELIDYLVDIRRRLMLPETVVFEILSGYRSPKTNDKLRFSNGQVAKESFHMRGWAVDFRLQGVDGRAVAEIAKTMQRGGVSYYPSSNHVHVDLGNIRTWATK